MVQKMFRAAWSRIQPLSKRYVELPPEARQEWGRGHLLDYPSRLRWVWLSYVLDFVLIAVVIGLAFMFSRLDPPNLRFRLDDPSISYPKMESIISDSMAIIFPIVGIALLFLSFVWVREPFDLLHSVFGIVQSFVFSFFTVAFLWWSIGGLRPSFLAICDPDPARVRAPTIPGGVVYYEWHEICRADYSHGIHLTEDTIQFGMRAFPSGHVYFIMVPMLWVSMYWQARFKPFDGFSHFWKMFVVWILPAIGVWASFTRLRDYHHSVWQICFSHIVSVFWVLVFYRFHYRSWFGNDAHMTHHGMYKHFKVQLPIVDEDIAIAAVKQDEEAACVVAAPASTGGTSVSSSGSSTAPDVVV